MAFRFSVVIPSYNRAALLAECMAVFLTPAAAGLDVVVVDDGSTDDSVAVAQRLAAQSRGARIRVVQQANGGASAARNRGIAEVTSDWVAFLDSDDLWFPWSLGAVDAALGRAGSAGLLFLQMQGFADPAELATLAQQPLKIVTAAGYLDLYARRVEHGSGQSLAILGSCNVVVRRDLLLAANGFDGALRVAEDQDLFLRIGPEHTAAAIIAPVIVGHREPQGDNLSTNWDRMMTGLGTVLARWRAGRYAGSPALLRQCLALAVRIALWRLIAAGEQAKALALLRRETMLLAREFGWRLPLAAWRDALLGRQPRPRS